MDGRTLGHYRILEKLGEGGMGEVYLALDTTLERKVALKLLPEEMAADQSRFERFQREAKAVAALNHPNIVTIHTVEEAEGVHFLTMELVEGRRLDDVVPPGGLGLEQIFEISVPLAEAVAAAHQKGIVHRDLKPANVMITTDGLVKVLDFGLAKLADAGVTPQLTQMPTEAITAEGKVLGTVPYMSPEQVQGKAIDHRSDIFSLGIILYEMATGIRPFKGDTSADLISSILRDDPSTVTELKGTLPRHLGRIIRHCLEKEPGERYQSARDVRNELKGLRREIETGELQSDEMSVASGELSAVTVPASPRRRVPAVALVATVVVAVLVIALLVFGPLGTGDEPASVQAEAATPGPAGGTSPAGTERAMIVVLPFENLGPADDEYFADGISEEITSRLASLEGLGTISRSSARRYKNDRPPTAELGEALGVDYILEGTVRWERVEGGPSRVRVTPELIRVADDTSIWSERYDEELDRIFAVQSAIAEAVAEQLDLTLLAGDREVLEERLTENMEAYQTYLRASEVWNQPGFDVDRFELCAQMFERALELDPDFLMAAAKLPGVYGMLRVLSLEEHWVDDAKRALDRATEIDPDHPWTLLATGYYHYYSLADFDRALSFFEQAAELLPDDADTLQALAFIQRRRGELGASEEYLRRAAAVDPQASHLQWELGRVLLGQRRFPEAHEQFARATAMAPDEEDLWRYRAWAHVYERGDVEAAREIMAQMPGVWEGNGSLVDLDFMAREWESVLERLEHVVPGSEADQHQIAFAPELRGTVLLRLGREEEAEAAFRQALAAGRESIERLPQRPEPHLLVAFTAAALGDDATALAQFELAAEKAPFDEFWGPQIDENRAELYVLLGRHEEAIDLLAELLEREYDFPVTKASLRLDPAWDGLREDPGFQALID